MTATSDLQARAAERARAYGELAARYLGAPPGADGELTAEYTRLFVLPSGVGPHESLYLDENRRLGGRVTEAVRRYYESAGAQPAQGCLELPDHIGVELDFMNFLCGVEGELRVQADPAGLRKCLDFQRGFLTGHLLRWYRPLCDKVLSDSNSPEYQALAKQTLAFLDAERDLVPQLIEELKPEARTVCEPAT